MSNIERVLANSSNEEAGPRHARGASGPNILSSTSKPPLFERAQHLTESCDDLVDLLALDNERWRKCDRVARDPHQHATFETAGKCFVGTCSRRVRPRLQLDRADEPDVADVDDVRCITQRMDGLFPFFL